MKRQFLLAVMSLTFAVPLAQAHMPSEEQWNQHMQQWQARMNTMHQQMDALAKARDQDERQKLLTEHWRLMGEQMDDMNMMGGHMMGPGMLNHGMMGGMCGCPMCGMMHRHVMMMHGGNRRQMGNEMHDGMHRDMGGEE